MPAFNPGPAPEPTVINNYRGPEDHTSGRVVVDMKDQILFYRPSATPFLTITSGIKGSRTAKNRKFEWLEKDSEPQFVTETAALTPTGTTLTVSSADGDKLAANDILRNIRTGDVALVTAEAAGSVTITRAIGGAGQVGAINDVWQVIGSSYPDNSTLGTPKSITEYEFYNYTQIIRTPFAFTGRDLATELYGGSDKMNETKWQGVKHKRLIEKAMLFGKRHKIDASGSTHERTFTGGLEWAITTNRWDVSGITLTKSVFDQFLESALREGKGGYLYGSGTKYFFHSSRWGTLFSEWADVKLEYRVLDKQYGMKANVYQSPHGRLMLVHAPILDEPGAAGSGFIVDVNHVDHVTLRGRGTKLLSGREENDRDGEAYEYFSDIGLQVEHEKAHSYVTGLD